MLRIRLQRIGRKKSPTYRVVLSERTKDTQARSLEILGHYNPVVQPKIIELKVDRIKHWLSVGAQPSNTINNLLVNAGVIESDKKKSVTITNKRNTKIDGKKADAEEAKKATEEKAAEPAPADEAPSEDKAEEASVEEALEKKEEEVKEETKEEVVEEKQEEVKEPEPEKAEEENKEETK